MKLPFLSIAAITATLLTANTFAEDQPTGCKCEMMKSPAAAAAQTPVSENHHEQAELDKLVAEMNGNLGPKKIEAMAAIITRLVEQSKNTTASPAVAGVEAPKGEAHHH